MGVGFGDRVLITDPRPVRRGILLHYDQVYHVLLDDGSLVVAATVEPAQGQICPRCAGSGRGPRLIWRLSRRCPGCGGKGWIHAASSPLLPD